MKDQEIVDLYWNRDESALEESQRHYGAYCFSIGYAILHDREDTEECVNDTWMRAWNAIPPQRPRSLPPFFGRITRNLAFDRYKLKSAAKRGGGEFPLIFEELEECIPASDSIERTIQDKELGMAINRFLHTLPERDCAIFLARYWYSKPIREIARGLSMTETNIKTNLFRSRKKLRAFLEREGVPV